MGLDERYFRVVTSGSGRPSSCAELKGAMSTEWGWLPLIDEVVLGRSMVRLWDQKQPCW